MPTVFYRKVHDVISRYRRQVNDSVFFMTMENYTSATSYGFEMIYTNKVTKWWSTTLSGSWYRNIIDGSNVETSITSESFGWQARTGNMFRFKKGWEGSLSVFYNAPKETGQGIRKAMVWSDCAIKKSFLKDKILLSLSVRDVLGLGKFGMTYEGDDYKMDMTRYMEGRTFMLGLTWKMTGDYKSKEKRGNGNMNGGGEDDGGF
ncbi:hypothetical protein SDC9_44248 [bioreactor metagenome]|uniref:Outer membrane protein beta-barrel domain-containing protein n=1 Tax=bioreactor metagenome TaxID=1076179 RepID=A0A644W3M4_9ZZZZ